LSRLLTFVESDEVLNELSDVCVLLLHEGEERYHEALLTWLSTHVTDLLHSLVESRLESKGLEIKGLESELRIGVGVIIAFVLPISRV